MRRERTQWSGERTQEYNLLALSQDGLPGARFSFFFVQLIVLAIIIGLPWLYVPIPGHLDRS